MDFEQEFSQLNEFYFFKEFTYSNNRFHDKHGAEVEIADSIIALDDIFLVYQLKDRNQPFESTEENESKWFMNKVMKGASRQIRDTMIYIAEYDHLILTNNQGHSLNISTNSIHTIQKLIIHNPGKLLPEECRNVKFHISRSAGVIHVIPANDYLGVLRYLVTPAEVVDYLEFREQLILKWKTVLLNVREPAILGQYLSGKYSENPSNEFLKFTARIRHNLDEWDMSGIIKLFKERITTMDNPTDYYKIISEIAKLKRNELKLFRVRFLKAWDSAKKNKFDLPYRFGLSRTNCGFVFIPLEREFEAHSRNALINFTEAHKYDIKFDKCIGVSFVANEKNWQNVEWCFIDYPWQYSQEFYDLLKENNPFRDVSVKDELEIYEFE